MLHSNAHRIVLASLLTGVALTAVGTDTTDYSTYVQFTLVDTYQKDYHFSRQNGWNPRVAPAKGAKNYVPVGKVLASEYSSLDPHVFAGDELAIAGGFLHAREAVAVTEVPVLAFCAGGYYTIPSSANGGRGQFRSGATYIRATTENPAQLRWPADSAKTTYPALNLTLYGEPDAELQAVNVGEGSSTYGFKLTGSLANYRGTLTIAEGARLRFGMTDNSVPATLKVADGGVLDMSQFTSDFTVGTFDWSDGGILSVPVLAPSYAKLVVTDSFACSGTPKIAFKGVDKIPFGTPPVCPVIILSGSAAESVPDLSAIEVEPIMGPIPNIRFVVSENPDGTKTISVTWKEVVYELRNYSSTSSSYSAMLEANKSYWSNGELPMPGYDYYIASNMLWSTTAREQFKGDSMVVAGGYTVRLARDTVVISNLHLLAASGLLFSGGNSTKHLYGRITVWPGDDLAQFRGYQNKQVHIHSEIEGSGNLRLQPYTTASDPRVTYFLEGVNTNFSGRVRIVTSVTSGSSDYPAQPDVENGYYATVQVGDARGLGGAYAGDDPWQAIQLVNSSRLRVVNDVAITEPTRGVFISTKGYVEAREGATLAIRSGLTLDGELVKVGAGDLELGTRLIFTDGDPQTEPTAERNLITIAEGGLVVAATNACDGAAVSLAEGTRLVVDVSATGDGVRAFGLVNTRAGGSLTVAGDALNVTFVGVAPAEDGFEAAVCTLPLAAAQALKVSVTCKVRGYRVMKTDVRDNQDGTGTVFANFERKGLCVILR